MGKIIVEFVSVCKQKKPKAYNKIVQAYLYYKITCHSTRRELFLSVSGRVSVRARSIGGLDIV